MAKQKIDIPLGCTSVLIDTDDVVMKWFFNYGDQQSILEKANIDLADQIARNNAMIESITKDVEHLTKDRDDYRKWALNLSTSCDLLKSKIKSLEAANSNLIAALVNLDQTKS